MIQCLLFRLYFRKCHFIYINSFNLSLIINNLPIFINSLMHSFILFLISLLYVASQSSNGSPQYMWASRYVCVLRLAQEVCFEWTHVDTIHASVADDSFLHTHYADNMLFKHSAGFWLIHLYSMFYVCACVLVTCVFLQSNVHSRIICHTQQQIIVETLKYLNHASKNSNTNNSHSKLVFVIVMKCVCGVCCRRMTGERVEEHEESRERGGVRREPWCALGSCQDVWLCL